MTGTEFRTLHGDPTTWTAADIESFEVLRRVDQRLAYPDPERDFARCSQRWATGTAWRRHQKAKASANRLRQLLGRAA
ncbi:hypothetical protein ACIOEZ_34420 [Streptomyces sp. NPDC087866]|uniref:hypothetical protein n=1 Tax=Streptomyces sp. NPDC087866 TaxID=3365815 RepID=UPI00382E2844